MPKFRFCCNKCGKEVLKIVPASWSFMPCECGGNLTKQLPNLKKTVNKEKVEKNRNIDWIEDQEKMIKDRSLEEFYKHEVPRLVQSGEHSIRDMEQRGWIYRDDKGNFQIRTTPPSKDPNIKTSTGKK